MSRSRILTMTGITLAASLLAIFLACRSVQKRQVEFAWRQFTRELASDERESAYESMSTAFRQTRSLSAFTSSRWYDKAHPWFVAVVNRDIHIVYVHLDLLGRSSRIIATTSVRTSLMDIDNAGVRVVASLVREGVTWKVEGEPSVVAE